MANLNKSSIFLRKVRNQVLKNREIEHVPKYYVFGKMEHYDDSFRNDFITRRKKKEMAGGVIRTVKFYGPEDYLWKHDTTFCFFDKFDQVNHGYPQTIFVLPCKWLRRYDPNIPIILIGRLYPICFVDLEKHKWASSKAYLIRDRFRTADPVCYPSSEDLMPYSIRKGDEEWCITYFNFHSFHMHSFTFWSFLLIKNIDLSKFDAIVEAKSLNCPVRYYGNIKFQDDPENSMVPQLYASPENSCFCINCRKDYLSIEVKVYVEARSVTLYSRFLLK